MAPAGSLFIFELLVDELKCNETPKEYNITAQFSDVFKLHLRDPNQLESKFDTSWRPRRKKKKSCKYTSEAKVEIEQAVLFEANISDLIKKMKKVPLVLTLTHSISDCHGSAIIPWSLEYFTYMEEISCVKDLRPLSVTKQFMVRDTTTGNRMARLKLTVKIVHVKDKNWGPKLYPSPDVTKHTGQFGHRDKNWTPKVHSSTDQDTKCTGQFGHRDKNFVPKTHPSVDKDTKDTVLVFQNKTDSKRALSTYNETESSPLKVTSKLSREITERQTEHKIETNIDYTASNQLAKNGSWKVRNSLVSLVRSSTHMESRRRLLQKSRSLTSIRERFTTLNYIFGDLSHGNFGNQVYCVGYVTVHKSNKGKSPQSSGSSSGRTSPGVQSAEDIDTKYFTMKVCDNSCANPFKGDEADSSSILSLDLPEAARELINITRCTTGVCNHIEYRRPLTPPDESILVDLRNFHYQETEVVEGKQPCYCSCDCTFGFVKKTTYCHICGGYLKIGQDLKSLRPGQPLPYPCPFDQKDKDQHHHHQETPTVHSWSKKSNSEVKKNQVQPGQRTSHPATIEQSEVKKNQVQPGQRTSHPATIELSESVKQMSETSKKKRSFKANPKFKNNHNYFAPKYGHWDCGHFNCGDAPNVPKEIGWLWTSEDIPGLKFRPGYKPGATTKQLAKIYDYMKNPAEAIAKRKRLYARDELPDQRPLLVVHKKRGEFNITMETMRKYKARDRAPNQQPFEEKKVVVLTVGRTAEENLVRQKKRERLARRLEREERDFIQCAFRNMCQQICGKTYDQALMQLPFDEDSRCPCFPEEPTADQTDLEHSCSCSDILSSMTSDTDNDEWKLEFSPPIAYYNPNYEGRRIIYATEETQYSYLHYKVKLLDRFGNPVPRFFKGPDGAMQCSDLGGFWSPDHQWLEINVDGYVGPDGVWFPSMFMGPDGKLVHTELGKFQTEHGRWLVVGVDGYVQGYPMGHWKYYKAPSVKKERQEKPKTKRASRGVARGTTTEVTAVFTCYGDTSPTRLSERGIVGHGHDRKLLLYKLQEMLSKGLDVTIPRTPTIPRSARSPKTLRLGRTTNDSPKKDYSKNVNAPMKKSPAGEGHHPNTKNKAV